MIPVSAVILTLNEEAQIERCLVPLSDFAEVIVVDSGSADKTAEIAKAHGAQVVDFKWNGQYPKKRQWCLDNLTFKHDWVFFIDADEVMTPELIAEIKTLFEKGTDAAAYFVRGRYILNGKVLKFGLKNNKLCLLDRRKMEYPVLDDLDMLEMGEIEGHYQPVLKAGYRDAIIGQLSASLIHDAYEHNWEARHRRYAVWESRMNEKDAWPEDPVKGRQILKQIFRALPCRPLIAFLHCYILKLGMLDGREGFTFAASRYRYYKMIAS